MFDYNPSKKKAAEELDKYDFTKLLKQCCKIGWRDPLSIGLKGIVGRFPELEDSVRQIGPDDLVHYLMAKYPVFFRPKVSVEMYFL